MNEKTIDARGLGCPEPVIRARNAILEAGAGTVRVLVDDEVSVENIRRMAANQGWDAAIQRSGAEIRLTLTRRETPAASPAQARADASSRVTKTVVFVASDVLGVGVEELGRILMRAFVKTLKEVQPKPDRAIFINSGVRLTTEGSDLVDDLRALEQSGVEILSCGTCLDYYGLLDSLRVGRKSNMLEIVSALLEADRVLRP